MSYACGANSLQRQRKAILPMRKNIHSQPQLVPQFIEHAHAFELEAISARLDALPKVSELVLEDLSRGLKDVTKGRNGMSADTVLRVVLVKQMRGFSYDLLAFHLADSQTYRGFCRIGLADTPPSASALQRDVKKIRPETLEQINRLLLGAAADDGIEKGRTVRVDCTVTETNIHEPMDSEQLWDCVIAYVSWFVGCTGAASSWTSISLIIAAAPNADESRSGTRRRRRLGELDTSTCWR